MDTQGKAVKLVNSKLTTSKSSSSSTRSIGVTRRSMSKKLKDSSQMTPLTEYIQKDLDSLNHASEGLTKHVQEQDAQIARLIHKADNVDASHVMGKQVEAHDEAEVSTKQRYTENDKSAKELQVSSDGLIPVDQLKEFIEGKIRSKIEGSSKSSLTYSKPYTPRIDNLKMPMVINHQSSSNLMAKAILRSTWLISLKRATMQERMVIIWSSNSSDQ
ncbi:UNVERIFIED_CONTAM: hypothetical protein Sradi_1551600 [Sesamum radiatum]|uniref:Uncharacterized protein n=1 Tax=Sesamum radiatum TaxID=300843 RepID=A0AAW2U8I6_SESRA